MRLRVTHPTGRVPERRYALDVVLGEFLGLTFDAVEANVEGVRIASDAGSGSVDVPDVFFRRWLEVGTTQELLPTPPLPVADPSGEGLASRARTVEPSSLPLLYATGPGAVAAAQDGHVELGIDVFGSAFFMLTRLEELVLPDRDAHGRFPAAASIAARGAFLHRPLISEYVELLWTALAHVWPRLERRARSFRVVPTHDVDWPLCMRKPSTAVARDVLGDVVRRRDPLLAARRALALAATRRGNLDADVCNTFDFIMDVSEQAGVASAFYFIAAGPEPVPHGCDYSLDDPWIRALLGRIARRGHEIGLHGSYDGYRDPARTARELDALAEACDAAGGRPDSFGGRQHYLRWENPTTWRCWEAAGLAYDSTLGFAEAPGFRAGVCHEFPVFDLEEGRRLALRERPLVVMEASLTDYLGLHGAALVEEATRLRRACRVLDGDFVVLWHNNRLLSRGARDAYRRLLGDA